MAQSASSPLSLLPLLQRLSFSGSCPFALACLKWPLFRLRLPMFDDEVVDDKATLALMIFVDAAQEQGVCANQAAIAAAELVLAIYAGEYDPDPVSVTH